jgi:peptidoglycan hydrolase-like protein with peptidoglycan-binding domain
MLMATTATTSKINSQIFIWGGIGAAVGFFFGGPLGGLAGAALGGFVGSKAPASPAAPAAAAKSAAKPGAATAAKPSAAGAGAGGSGGSSAAGGDPIIKAVQHLINLTQHGPLTEDGKTGPMTQAAVTRYQQGKALPVNGNPKDPALISTLVQEGAPISSAADGAFFAVLKGAVDINYQ